MTPKTTPEWAITNENGKQKLIDLSKIPKMKLTKNATILGLLNFIEQEHKNGKLRQISVREYHDKIIITNLQKT